MPGLVNFLLDHADGFRRARLPSLYSDFQLQRRSNPDGFAANYATWLDGLMKASQAGMLPTDGSAYDTLSIKTGASLLQALDTKEWGRPLALGAVIDEALMQRKMIPYDEFLTSTKGIYGRWWTVQPWWLLSWAFSQMSRFQARSAAGSLPNGRFVSIQSVESAGTLIVAKLGGKSSRFDRIYPMASFKQQAAEILGLKSELSVSDTAVLLKYLARDKGRVVYNNNAVLFKTEGDHSSILTQEDSTIASLKASVTELQKQVDLISTSILAASEKAKQAISQKNRTLAVTALKSRKLREKTLTQRAETLTQLEETLSSIEQATDQITLVKMMKDSTAVLQGLQKEIGGIDNVQDVVEQLREETSKVDEVGQVIQDVGQEASVVTEEDVEEELEALLQEAKGREEEESLKRLEDLNLQGELQKVAESPRRKQGEQSPTSTPDRHFNADHETAYSHEQHHSDGVPNGAEPPKVQTTSPMQT